MAKSADLGREPTPFAESQHIGTSVIAQALNRNQTLLSTMVVDLNGFADDVVTRFPGAAAGVTARGAAGDAGPHRRSWVAMANPSQHRWPRVVVPIPTSSSYPEGQPFPILFIGP
jgi:hypothetical protein